MTGTPETAIDRLARLSGVTPEEIEGRYRGSLSATATANRVERTPEYIRIEQMPRRDWSAGAVDLAARITEAFRTPTGTMTLRSIQAAALYDLYTFGGVFAPINVGGGKTLTSFLAPAIVGASRPLLLIPASLREKTEREFEALRAHWQGPVYVRIVTYEGLGRVQSAEILETYLPDIIIADEAHRLKNLRAAVTRRVVRYMKKHGGRTRFVALSGTMTNRSIMDYAHLQEWCLPRTPFLPSETRAPGELEAWAAALNEDRNAVTRPSPGALFGLCDSAERALISADPLGAARSAYRRRMVETPGVIATQGGRDAVDASLEVSTLRVLHETEEVDRAFESMRSRWETPDGHPIADALSLWRHARELACGFYYRWNPRPPEDWLEARKSWAKACRDILSRNRRGLDSELAVVQAVRSGLYPEAAFQLDAWTALKPTFTPNTECVWVSRAPLDTAAEWASRHVGIVWCEHTFFAEALAQLTGLTYYGRGGCDASGAPIEAHPGNRALIASVASNHTGRNLQKWCRNLVVSAGPTGKLHEQLIGRTHRPGQLADTVYVDYLINCAEQLSGLHQARRDSLYIQQTTGQDQKLQYCDWTVPTEAEACAHFPGVRWRR